MANEIKMLTVSEFLDLVRSQKDEFIISVDIEHAGQGGGKAGDGQADRV